MNTSIGASSPPGYVAACMSRGMGASIDWHKLERDEIAVHVAAEFISNIPPYIQMTQIWMNVICMEDICTWW